MINFSLKNKIALISGASRGIGEAIALTFAEYGARCILVSRKLEGLQEVVQKIRTASGQAEAIICNTGYVDQIEKLFEEVLHDSEPPAPTDYAGILLAAPRTADLAALTGLR